MISAASSDGSPLVTAVEIGYGHLRAAHSLASFWGVELVRADRPPHCAPWERLIWGLSRRLYEGISRASQGTIRGAVARPLLDLITRIGPPAGSAGDARPTLPARHLAGLAALGFGRSVVEAARSAGRPLVTTFFVPALAAHELGYDRTWCLVTDTDAARAWVPAASRETRVTFLAPSRRVVERLRSYGVPSGRIEDTGFPLPPELLGGPDLPALRRNLGLRLARLDPHGHLLDRRRDEIARHLGEEHFVDRDRRPPLLTYAVGGAGAQAGLARRILADLRPALDRDRIRLLLVAGTRRRVAERFSRWIKEVGLEGGPVEVLVEPDPLAYFDSFHRALVDTDILWTKPSEMTFFAALGLPLLLAPPVGAQERANRRWAEAAGAAISHSRAEGTGALLAELAENGELARAAWAGFRRLPSRGLYRIASVLERERERGALSFGTRRVRAGRAPSSRVASRP